MTKPTANGGGGAPATDMAEDLRALADCKRNCQRRYAKIHQKSSRVYIDNRVLEALHETALGLMQRLDLDEVLLTIANRAAELMKTEHAFIFLLDADGKHFARKVALGIYAKDQGRRIRVGEGLVGEVHKTAQPIIVDDYSNWDKRLTDPFFDQIRGIMHVPLQTAKEVVGSFGVAVTEPDRKFSRRDVVLLTRFAEIAALAIDNAFLYSRMQQELAERVRAEETLRKVEEDQRALLDAIPDLIFTLNRDGVFLDYRAKSEADLYVAPHEFIGKTVREVMPPMVAQGIMHHIEAAFATGAVQTYEYQLPILGKALCYEARIVVNARGKVLAIVRDLTESKHIAERLEYLSLRDALTDLYNREYFEEELARLEKIQNVGKGIIVYDVDGLKLVNDSLGHSVGDDVLRAAADVLRSCFRGGAMLARIGGDEFAVLMTGCSAEKLAAASHCVRDAIEEYNAGKPAVPLSISAGFAFSGGKPVKAIELFREAENNMYREKLHRNQSARSAIVQTLARALEARDFITEGHADRMQDLAAEFAAMLGLPERNISDLRLLAQFHDIGKVGIPDSILFKPDRLTADEWCVMQRHCEIGYRIARSSSDLAPIADWILKHHEWWNGRGYPKGLSGAEIPVECRILSIIDAFDAMTNDRPYRQALSKVDAVAELERCSGAQFDPNLVSLFVEMVQSNPQ